MKKKIYCFISTPFKLLVPFQFICFDNPALKISFSVFSSVYFPRCCFKITFISVLIFLLHLFGQLHQLFLFSSHFTTPSMTSSSVLNSAVTSLICVHGQTLLFSVSVRIASHQCPPLTICFSSSFSPFLLQQFCGSKQYVIVFWAGSFFYCHCSFNVENSS